MHGEFIGKSKIEFLSELMTQDTRNFIKEESAGRPWEAQEAKLWKKTIKLKGS
jgi:hypothetical protein